MEAIVADCDVWWHDRSREFRFVATLAYFESFVLVLA
jgi:hypothetical protein